MTIPHGARTRTGRRGRRPRRRSGLRSLVRTRPDSTRPHPAQRTTAMLLSTFDSLDSSEPTSSVRVPSIAEEDGDEDVVPDDSSVEIASVTPPSRAARNRACRSRPDARPPGVRPYTRFDPRCRSRRRARAHPAHRAFTDAQPPQNTKTRVQPPQRPNLPSTKNAALLRSGWTSEALAGSVTHGERVLRCARHEGPGD